MNRWLNFTDLQLDIDILSLSNILLRSMEGILTIISTITYVWISAGTARISLRLTF